MRKTLARTSVALLTLGLATATWADHETHSYGVANFDGSGQCTNGSTHSVHADTANEFDDAFDDLQSSGLWDSSYVRNNTSVRGSYFEDASKQASADDLRSNYGADEADVIFLHTHGGHSTSGGNYYSSLSMGNSSYDCSVRTDSDMYWDADLDIAVIKACQSGDYDVFINGGYRPEYVDADGQMRMWNAFHGDSSCGNHVKRYVGRYARNVTYNAVGDEWIDQAYDSKWGSNNDDCPVSIVFGSSSANRNSMYEYGGWRDRKNTGSRTGASIFYVSGCDPSNGRSLP
jgi:hypothetical protein